MWREWGGRGDQLTGGAFALAVVIVFTCPLSGVICCLTSHWGFSQASSVPILNPLEAANGIPRRNRGKRG